MSSTINLRPGFFSSARAASIEPAAHIAARHRHGVHIHRTQGVGEGIVVERERALQKRLPGEDDEPDAPTPVPLHIIHHGQLGPFEAVRAHVGNEHAFRGIEHEDRVFALLLELLRLQAPLRPGERQAEEDDGEQHERILHHPPHRAVRQEEARHEAFVRKARELLTAGTGAVRDQDGCSHQCDGEEPQPLGVFKMGIGEVHQIVHGTRR